MRYFWRLCTVFGISALYCLGVSKPGTDESKLKAEFLVRFVGFTSWPLASFQSATSHIVIGVWGDSDFTEVLSSTIGSRTAGGRKIVARTIRRLSEIRSVHVVYVPASERSLEERVLTAASGLPVLTVSETTGFCRRGGMLNFYRDGDYIRFEANPEAVKKAGLYVSSQLLRLARIVRG